THVAIEPNRLLVTAQGTVAHADRAFATTIDSWSVNGKTLYANATAAKVPAALGGTVLSVLGLNDAAVMTGGAVQHKATNALPNWLQALVTQVAQQVQQTTTTITQTVTSTTSAVTSLLGSAPPAVQKTVTTSTNTVTSTVDAITAAIVSDLPSYLVSYTPQAFWKAYDVGSTPSGARTPIAIFGAGDMTSVLSDLRTEEKADHLPQVGVTVDYVGLKGPENGADEWDMDTQFSTGMAGGVSHLYIYSATTLTDSDLALA